MYWNEYKTKSESKNTIQQYRYFLESNFIGASKLYVVTYSNQDDNVERYKTRKYYLLKFVIENYIVIINRKNFFDQPIDSKKDYTT